VACLEQLRPTELGGSKRPCQRRRSCRKPPSKDELGSAPRAVAARSLAAARHDEPVARAPRGWRRTKTAAQWQADTPTDTDAADNANAMAAYSRRLALHLQQLRPVMHVYWRLYPHARGGCGQDEGAGLAARI
jgi:hypothetical protein